MFRPTLLAAAVLPALFLAACAGQPAPSATATATLSPTQGRGTAGRLNFQARGEQVAVQARITGLKPNAEHGFHVHEKGDCSAPDGTSAGGHFNPHGQAHGHPHTGMHHAGDMPALRADANGVAEVSFTMPKVTIGSGAADLVGRAVIVHAMPDDYRTQPTGNAGARIACGVIVRG